MADLLSLSTQLSCLPLTNQALSMRSSFNLPNRKLFEMGIKFSSCLVTLLALLNFFCFQGSAFPAQDNSSDRRSAKREVSDPLEVFQDPDTKSLENLQDPRSRATRQIDITDTGELNKSLSSEAGKRYLAKRREGMNRATRQIDITDTGELNKSLSSEAGKRYLAKRREGMNRATRQIDITDTGELNKSLSSEAGKRYLAKRREGMNSF
ncbi:uncharacterized protein [Hemitrygon akajei]|uniref:uncharacterized protein n=1 Tax=Hemitrygon akajei TaxID=2704970 RepID=UPI003BFA23E4